jgi:hypothetical protein
MPYCLSCFINIFRDDSSTNKPILILFFLYRDVEWVLFIPSGERYFHSYISSVKNVHNQVNRVCVMPRHIRYDRGRSWWSTLVRPSLASRKTRMVATYFHSIVFLTSAENIDGRVWCIYTHLIFNSELLQGYEQKRSIEVMQIPWFDYMTFGNTAVKRCAFLTLWSRSSSK